MPMLTHKVTGSQLSLCDCLIFTPGLIHHVTFHNRWEMTQKESQERKKCGGKFFCLHKNAALLAIEKLQWKGKSLEGILQVTCLSWGFKPQSSQILVWQSNGKKAHKVSPSLWLKLKIYTTKIASKLTFNIIQAGAVWFIIICLFLLIVVQHRWTKCWWMGPI